MNPYSVNPAFFNADMSGSLAGDCFSKNSSIDICSNSPSLPFINIEPYNNSKQFGMYSL